MCIESSIKPKTATLKRRADANNIKEPEMAEEVKDKMVKLVNPAGVLEDVWDYPAHVDRLLTIGWTLPISAKDVPVKLITTKLDKEN